MDLSMPAEGPRTENDRPDPLVGAWYVDAINAPFVPHQFVFTSDGLVLTTNPTNVQEVPLPGHPEGVNDSVGMGVWEPTKRSKSRQANIPAVEGFREYQGTFYQLNADAQTHEPAETLRVTFEIVLNTAMKTFSGPAVVHVADFREADARLEGRQLLISESDLELLS